MRKLMLYLVVPQILLLFAAELMVLERMQVAYPGGHPDLFAPYQALMPGQPAAPYGNCAWRYQRIPGAAGEQIYCEVHPGEGAFISVYADVYNSRFVGISFYANDLYVGDIVRHWGWPDLIVKNGSQFYVRWDTGEYAVLDTMGGVERFQIMQPLARVMVGLVSPTSSG